MIVSTWRSRSATAVVSEPPRPSVVTLRSVDMPWKPATSTMWPSASASRRRSARMSRILALVCEASVTMPACEPVNERAPWPRSWRAMATRAHEMRSPVDRSMSISRGSGRSEISRARATSPSVVLPRADTTARTSSPSSRAWAMRRATFLILSASATELPPNFITRRPMPAPLPRRVRQGRLEPSAAPEQDDQEGDGRDLQADAEAEEGGRAADVVDHPAEVLAEEAGDEGERQEDPREHGQLLGDDVQPV